MFAHEFFRNALLAGTRDRARVRPGRLLRRAARAGVRRRRAQSRRVHRRARRGRRRHRHPHRAVRGHDRGRAAARRARRALAPRRRRRSGSCSPGILGLGVLFLAIFSAGSGGGNGLLGARTLFGSIFGLSGADAALAAVIAAGIIVAAVLAIARPLLFASVDPGVAAARGVPVRAARAAAPRAPRRDRRRGHPGGRRAAAARAARRPGRRRPAAHRQPIPRARASAALAVVGMWLGLALSYAIPKLPPSTAIIAVATGDLPARVPPHHRSAAPRVPTASSAGTES